eukprot:122900_1
MINNNVLPGNVCNITHQATSLSIASCIESRNRILTIITNMFDNLQKLLLHYNNAFTFSIQSLTNTVNHSLMQSHDTLNQNTLNHIQTCLIVQQKMWKEILNHKRIADSQLSAVQSNIRRLQQQKLIFINPINFHIIPTATAPIRTIIPITTQPQIVLNQRLPFLHNQRSQISNARIAPSTSTVPSTVTTETAMHKKKRKRRGYNGPYSVEEKQFMTDFNDKHKCDTTDDIIALSEELATKFKVKRSPYGLAQKMYQMNIINSRLKALFQRKFEDEDKEQMVVIPEHVSHATTAPHTTEDADTDGQSTSYDCAKRWRPFVQEEVQFIRELIQRYEHENSRKLYWRFLQRFADWKDDSKAYQRFYHKYWTLITEHRNKKNIRDAVRNTGNSNCHVQNERKRTRDTVKGPCKRFKASCDEGDMD